MILLSVLLFWCANAIATLCGSVSIAFGCMSNITCITNVFWICYNLLTMYELKFHLVIKWILFIIAFKMVNSRQDVYVKGYGS